MYKKNRPVVVGITTPTAINRANFFTRPKIQKKKKN